MTAPRPPSAAAWQQLRACISRALGLGFSRDADLRRMFQGVVTELGFDDEARCIAWLIAQPPTHAVAQVLGRHLTIGETYFFRDRAALDVLRTQVLPALIEARRGHGRRLRLWCAACCTGEEAYTMAMLLIDLLPDIEKWDVSILGTDINTEFLRKAQRGVYGEWSFRDVPPNIRARHFTQDEAGRYTVRPSLRRLVNFEFANLLLQPQESSPPKHRRMDVVMCRNALMYFEPQQIPVVTRRLADSLLPGGHLIVGPGEIPSVAHAGLFPVHFPGAILFRKPEDGDSTGDATLPASYAQETGAVAATRPSGEHGDFPALRAMRPEAPEPAGDEAPPRPDPVEVVGRSARALADSGRLDEALVCCDEWIGADRLNAHAHYVKAVVLQEMGALTAAHGCLQRAIYLDSDLVLAHVALGHLERSAGNEARAARHFGNAQRLLERCEPEQVLPDANGLTALQLSHALRAMTAPEVRQ
jgi:chemotaxis protein methyltransferase CheR